MCCFILEQSTASAEINNGFYRLIVVAEKEVVYLKFPIPLINRLEKHVLAMTTMLNEWQKEVLKQLTQWAKTFVDVETRPMTTRYRN